MLTGIELDIANALWADRTFSLAPAFVEECRQLYGAEARVLDFQNPGSAEIINEWVRELTRNKIGYIVDAGLLSITRVLLANAIYFQGEWAVKFKKDNTQEGIFLLNDGRQKLLPFMRHPAIRGVYRQTGGFEGAVLWYQNSSSRCASTVQFCVVLPEPGRRPEDAFTEVDLNRFLDDVPFVELDLRMPRFKLSFDGALSPALQSMGMGNAFRSDADFDRMGSPEFCINEVLHRSYMEVDEVGTIAAAAVTFVRVGQSRAKPREPEKRILIIDRPFALFICDRQTGTVLFAGVVYEPVTID